MTSLVDRLVPDEWWGLFRRVVPAEVLMCPQGGGRAGTGREALAAIMFVATTWVHPASCRRSSARPGQPSTPFPELLAAAGARAAGGGVRPAPPHPARRRASWTGPARAWTAPASALAPVDCIPRPSPGASVPPADALLGDKGRRSRANDREPRRGGMLSVISRRGEVNIHGLGKLRYVVEQTFALLRQFERVTSSYARTGSGSGTPPAGPRLRHTSTRRSQRETLQRPQTG
jgi:hypothetical protein